MMELSFLFKKKILARLKKRTIFASVCLVMKMSWFFQFVLDQKFEDSIDLLLLIDDDKSHYVYINVSQNKK